MLRSLARFLSLASPVLLASACAPSLSPSVRGTAHPVPPVLLAVFRPVDARAKTDEELSSDAADVVREEYRRELKSAGCPMAPDRTLDSMVRTSVATGDLSWEEANRLAQRVGADLGLVTRISQYRRGWVLGPSSEVKLRVDVVDPEGKTLWTVTHGETAAQEDPALLARDVAGKAARTLIAAWGGCKID